MTAQGSTKSRRDRCIEYLRRAGSMPAAQKLANEEGFTQNTSVWIGALGQMLKEDADGK